MAERLDDKNFRITDENGKSEATYLEDEPSPDSQTYGDGTKTPSDDEYGSMIGDAKVVDQDEFDSDTYDKYIGAEVLLDVPGEGPMRATVKARKRHFEGNPIGKRHKHVLYDTREYEVEFDDGRIDHYTTNNIAANIYSMVDSEGRRYQVLKQIVDHRYRESAVKEKDAWVETDSGRRYRKKTTRGVEFSCEFTDGNTHWVPLSTLMHSNMIEIAEYAIANRIDRDPAFAWWVDNVPYGFISR